MLGRFQSFFESTKMLWMSFFRVYILAGRFICCYSFGERHVAEKNGLTDGILFADPVAQATLQLLMIVAGERPVVLEGATPGRNGFLLVEGATHSAGF